MGMTGRSGVYTETPDAIVLGIHGKKDIYFADADGQVVARLSDMLREICELKREALARKLDVVMCCAATNAMVLDYCGV
jgi:hypothetical protein